MATNSFKSKVSAAVGTSLTSVYTVPANTSSIIIGLNLACVTTTSVVADVIIDKASGDDANLIKNIPIPTGSSFEVLSGQKIVLEVGDIVKVRCDTASGMDVLLSFLEITS
jgi:hypothetical protein